MIKVLKQLKNRASLNRIGDSAINMVMVITAVVSGIAISMGIIVLSGYSPVAALKALIDGSVGSRSRIAITAARMSPLVVVSLGWIVAFRASKVNLGLQGQLIAGGIAAGVVAIEGPPLPPALAIALATLIGIMAGALYAAIAAVLWAKRGVNEIVSTLMLTFIAVQVLAWLIRGPIRDPASASFQSKPLQSNYRWPALVERTPFTLEVILTLATVAALVFVLSKTTFGFKLRLTGQNTESARHAGINTLRINVMSFVLSGGLAGLAGAGLVLGGERQVISGSLGGSIGFTGIIVALVALNSPVGCVIAAALFASLDTGGSLMQSRADIPSETILITQGIIVVFVGISGLMVGKWKARRILAGTNSGNKIQ